MSQIRRVIRYYKLNKAFWLENFQCALNIANLARTCKQIVVSPRNARRMEAQRVSAPGSRTLMCGEPKVSTPDGLVAGARVALLLALVWDKNAMGSPTALPE